MYCQDISGKFVVIYRQEETLSSVVKDKIKNPLKRRRGAGGGKGEKVCRKTHPKPWLTLSSLLSLSPPSFLLLPLPLPPRYYRPRYSRSPSHTPSRPTTTISLLQTIQRSPHPPCLLAMFLIFLGSHLLFPASITETTMTNLANNPIAKKRRTATAIWTH